MREVRGFSLGALALAIAATATFAAGTAADARTARHHGATHFAVHRAYHASPRWYRAYGAYGSGPAGAYGAMPGSVYAAPSYPGYGYGYGDNSNNYTN